MQLQQRTIVVGVVAVGLASAWISNAVGQPKLEQTKLRSLPPGCLQVISQPGAPVTAVVYDPEQQALGVYHIDRASGAIELKSIRQIEWDLQMLHYNGKEPLPEEIRDDLQTLGARKPQPLIAE